VGPVIAVWQEGCLCAPPAQPELQKIFRRSSQTGGLVRWLLSLIPPLTFRGVAGVFFFQEKHSKDPLPHSSPDLSPHSDRKEFQFPLSIELRACASLLPLSPGMLRLCPPSNRCVFPCQSYLPHPPPTTTPLRGNYRR